MTDYYGSHFKYRANVMALSRRFNSRSTAFRMRSARFSPSSKTPSILASVPAGSRAGIASWLTCFLPMEG